MNEPVHSKLTAKRPWFLESRTRLFVTLFLVLAIPAAIFISLSAVFIARQLEQETIFQNIAAARLVARQLDEEFFGLRRYVQSYATRHRMVNAVLQNNTQVLREQLQEMVEQNRKVSRVILAHTNGFLQEQYPVDPSSHKDLSDRDWFKGASKSERPYVSEIYRRSAMDKELVVTIACRVNDFEGNTLGYLAAQYALADVTDSLAAIRPRTTPHMTFFDHHGLQALATTHREIDDISNHSEIRKILNAKEGSIRIQNLAGYRECLVTHVPVPDLGWTVVAYHPTEIVFAPVKRLLRWDILFFGIALAAVALLGWLWFRVLYAYSEDLRRSNKELQNFCYSIAHNLRAPLRAMRGFSSAISEDCAAQLDAHGKDYTKRIDSAAEQMDKLILDLLDYGRIAHRPLDFELIDVDEELKKVYRELRAEIDRLSAKFDVKHPLGSVFGDRLLTGEVLRHLIGNALKYVAVGVTPQVHIWSKQENGHTRVFIQDNGIGIDSNHRERIFGVFERLHGHEMYSGTGIGLAIVRKAVERMGGTVGVDSQPGKGSCFWFDLPTR